MYKCSILADSVGLQGDRIITYKVTYPRIIHAEMCRHRILSRNSASSRAIPFKKMVKMVKEDPFIPIAWQKDHPGMQGTEYLSKTDTFNLNSFITALVNTLYFERDSKKYYALKNEIDEKVILIENLLQDYKDFTKTLDDWWLLARDKAVEAASILHVFRTTKQLCNRLLEPFLWHTEIITGTEYDNFFELRCPRYKHTYLEGMISKSKEDLKCALSIYAGLNRDMGADDEAGNLDTSKLLTNDSQAEIHIQAIAEMMWDAYNQSNPKQLQAGEWHIPFGDRFDWDSIRKVYSLENQPINLDIKIATSRCARISYETLGDNPKIDYEADVKLHDMLLESKHMSPFEHCAQVMSDLEYRNFTKTSPYPDVNGYTEQEGWCRNFKGFIQYRHLVEQ